MVKIVIACFFHIAKDIMQKESFLICNDACTGYPVSIWTGVKTPSFNNNPAPVLVTCLFFEFCYHPPPTPNFTASRLSLSQIVSKYITSICMKPFYNHLWRLLTSGGFMYKARISQVMVNRITRSMLMFL